MEILPAVPDGGDGPGSDPFADIGEFRQGSAISRWALARYLVGRAVAESVTSSLLVVAVVLLGLAGVLLWIAHATFWAVVVIVVAVAVLAMRALLRAMIGRLTAANTVGPVEARLRALISDTRSDVFAEMRRIGLPSHTLTLPLFVVRFAGRERRRATLERLREFDIERAVPPARLDELHLLVSTVLSAS